MVSRVDEVDIDALGQEALEDFDVLRGSGLMHGGVSVLVNVEWGHLLLEQKPYDLVEALITGPVEWIVPSVLLRVWLLNEWIVVLIALVASCGLGATLLLVVVEGAGIVLDEPTHDLLIAVTSGPKKG